MALYDFIQEYIREMEEKQGISFDRLCGVDLHVLEDNECFYCDRVDCPIHP